MEELEYPYTRPPYMPADTPTTRVARGRA
jgi:hypothetical protein